MADMTLSRRAALTGGAALALAPLSAIAAQVETPVQGLWREAEALRGKLEPHVAEIRARTESGGIPGWLRLTGDANRFGHARHQALVRMLQETPRNTGDLKLMAQASLDEGFRLGARSWAAEKLALATLALDAAA